MDESSVLNLMPQYQRVRLKLAAYLANLPVGTRIMAEKELAERFNVSRVTARKALKSFRDADILKSYPGRGTFLAKQLKESESLTTHTRLVGLLVPSVEAPMIPTIVRGVEAEASRRRYQVVLSHDHNDPELQVIQARKMLESPVAGMLVYPDRFVTDRPEFLEVLKEFKQRGKPLVLVDRYIPQIDAPCVMTDNVRGMFQVTEHLICSGRRRLALLGFWPTNTVHIDRRKGFIDALRAYGLPPKPVLEADIGVGNFERSAKEIVSQWVKDKSPDELPFDSIACMNDYAAHGAFLALREAGVRVPEDVAMIGYDNIQSEMFKMLGLDLTSVEQPLEQMGEAAVTALINLIENIPSTTKNHHVLLQPRLVIQTSCGSNKTLHAAPTA